MTRISDTAPQDAAEERLLREMYHERTPEHIDTERAWAAVAPRLALQTAGARQRHGLRLWPTRANGRRTGWRTGLGIAAALVALPVLLMGAGLAKERLIPIDPGMQRIEDEGLYQRLNQSQTVDGVTITITGAYADEGRTVYFYHVRISPELARHYRSALLGQLNVTAEPTSVQSAGGGLGVCAPWDSVTKSMSCYLVQGPFEPAAANHVTITFDVSRVYLTPPGAGSDEIDGHWRFQFTIPFHHMNIGSVEQFFPHLLHLAPTQPQP